MNTAMTYYSGVSNEADTNQIKTMTILNYQTGATIGTSTSIDEDKYEAYLAEDHTGTGAVKAGEWISDEERAELGIDADLAIYAF